MIVDEFDNGRSSPIWLIRRQDRLLLSHPEWRLGGHRPDDASMDRPSGHGCPDEKGFLEVDGSARRSCWRCIAASRPDRDRPYRFDMTNLADAGGDRRLERYKQTASR